ncbi:hypothetical protein [Marinitenerispora sediminis]|uniref:Uncharacterized protein n=1 Tax=Marinitenerispora sediminis TaxID=1931232 RepID=A0A368T327_9ACTN|nr:hypothetical protein [Marinitenerispora sediminis]RCV49159.1 hypothetical protein DEF28_21645 [Marinitenerispora sediminis]RCV55942.1 hypothetical protein DEF24_17340 [Marinitenerispora sediminis]RCV60400.1 hypothetical protein DEF23_04615 [Marinitenerispora sediminis]
MSYPIDDAEQLIATAQEELPPSTRSRLIAKLRMGIHIEDAARDLDVSVQRVFATARILSAFGDQLDATLTAERDPDLPHGTVTGYNKRCRCPQCRAAVNRRI